MGLSNSKSRNRVTPTRPVHWSSDVEAEAAASGHDFTSDLPDKLLAHIFSFLRHRDRKTCSTVCRRWLRVDGESHFSLRLYADRDLISFLPSILTRFDSIKKLTLWCDGRSLSVSDEALVLISKKCRRLKSLKLHGCLDLALTDHRIAAFVAKCKTLRMLQCSSSSSFAGNTFGGADWGETSKDHVINLDVLGIKKEDMKIEVENKRVLKISGERKTPKPSEGDDQEEKGGERVVWHRVERRGGWFWFWRRFKLPKNADMDNVKAHLEDRILKIRVPKLAEEYKKKKPIDNFIQIIS